MTAAGCPPIVTIHTAVHLSPLTCLLLNKYVNLFRCHKAAPFFLGVLNCGIALVSLMLKRSKPNSRLLHIGTREEAILIQRERELDGLSVRLDSSAQQKSQSIQSHPIESRPGRLTGMVLTACSSKTQPTAIRPAFTAGTEHCHTSAATNAGTCAGTIQLLLGSDPL